MSKSALILGGTGQDGAYLAQHLLAQGYFVAATFRPASSGERAFWRAEQLGVRAQVQWHPADVLDRASLDALFAQHDFAEVYNLAALSQPSQAARTPALCIRIAGEGLLNVLEAAGRARRVFQAGSLADYPTANGPYAIGKAAASALVKHYRALGWWVCEARMGNHESPLRSGEFVCQQIARAAARGERLALRDPNARKDIGWAPDYAREMHAMLQLPWPSDRVLCTGYPCTLANFQEAAMHKDYEPVEAENYTLWPQVAQRMTRAAREEQRA